MGINLKTKIEVEEIVLNDYGDSIFVSASDAMLFENFVNGYKKIVELSDQLPQKLESIEKKYEGKTGFEAQSSKAIEMSKETVSFSSEAVVIIDGIFGEGTTKKYFRNLYEKIPSFLPNADCFVEFMENITPEMERLFKQKIELQKKESRERMAKYQPQDHKRPGKNQ